MDSPGEEASDMVEGMMTLAQSFIDTEPDPADVTIMREVMDRLRSLGASESAEGEASFTQTSEKEDTEIEDLKDEEPVVAKSRRQDPLRKRSEDLALEIFSGGASLRKPPKVNKEEPPPEPIPERELRRRSNDLLMETLSG